MAINRFYTSGHAIQRFTNTVNAFGGYSQAWTTISTIDALINQASTSEIQKAEKLGYVATHKMYCSVDTVVNIDNRILSDGIVYRITSIPKNTVGRDNHYKIMLAQHNED